MNENANKPDAVIFTEFLKTVKEMRNAQKAYFKIKGFSELNKAKSLERKVDALIAEIECTDAGQLVLF